MTTKLIKHNDYWMVVSDEKPKENDLYLDDTNIVRKSLTSDYAYWKARKDYHKILFSQNPSLNLPTITFSDEVAKKLGIVDYSLEKAIEFAFNKFPKKYNKGIVTWESILDVLKVGVECGYKFGTKNRCLSDNADKKFTLEQIQKAFETGFSIGSTSSKTEPKHWNDFIQSLTKEEYFCELEMVNYCKTCNSQGLLHCSEANKCSDVITKPKTTNNSVKVIKIWK